ncbi:MAG: hypothetical protein RIR79_1733 [Pseudomonadota bacterium]
MWVFDLTGKRMRWANPAGLAFWNAASLDEFLARDFSNLSTSTIIRNQTHMDEHARGHSVREQWTLYPKGKPITLNAHSVSVELPEGGRAILYEGLLIAESLDPAVLRGVEAMQQTPLIIGLYRVVDGSVVMRNPSGVECFGIMDTSERRDDFSTIFFEPAQAQIALHQLRQRQAYNAEVELITLKGVRWYNLDVRPVLDPVTGEAMLQINAQDISQRKAVEEEVRQLAFYDPLTQLPNRRLLLDRLQQALRASHRNPHNPHNLHLGALLFIDLDNFKMLNDTLGHDMGDRLLQQVALRLLSCIRPCDTVARLGGDEFVIMLENLSDVPLEAIVQTEVVGNKILTVLNQPYDLTDQPYHCTASLGATLFGNEQNNAQNSVDELMKRADLAMYESKSVGRNTMRFFDPQMLANIQARAALEADLRRGLLNQEFVLYYQSQVNESNRIIGVEALVRWKHPTRGFMSPATFIPLAEETGLISPLGFWVLETACQQLAKWAEQPQTADFMVSVNVSAIQFRQSDFVEHVLALVHRTGANPCQLKLELTESLLLDNVEDIIAKMTALKAWGIGFALDDFGTGYSSLSYLKRLPLDQLKIDQTFVRDLLTDPNDAVIARTIIVLAHSMGLSVIAEGVETQAQRDCLANAGCRAYQGYLFGKPMPPEAFN